MVSKIGTMIDKYIRLDDAVKEVDVKLKKAKEKRTECADFILSRYVKEDIRSARGKLGQISRTERNVPSVFDWDKLCAYVKRHNAFELLQKRVTQEAYKERVDAGKKVPGVEIFTKIGLSISRKGG